MQSAAHSNTGPSDATTMKQLGIVVLALVGVTLGLIVAVTVIT